MIANTDVGLALGLANEFRQRSGLSHSAMLARLAAEQE